MANGRITATVTLCAHTEDRWDDIVAAVAAIGRQTRPADQFVMVIDHNEALLARVRSAWPDLTILPNEGVRGDATSRNTAVAHATGDIIVFLDDDARPEENWLEELLAGYDDPLQIGTGGYLTPAWPADRPGWFPREFDWVVGCSYQGMALSGHIRNAICANMSVRRSVFLDAGAFRVGFGRIGYIPYGGTETDFCIRATRHVAGGYFAARSAAIAHHRVPPWRTTFRYFIERCYREGISKYMLSRLLGGGDSTSAEWDYTLRTLPAGVLRGLGSALTGDFAGVQRAGAISAGFGVTVWGYLWARVAVRQQLRGHLALQSEPAR